MGSLLKPVGHTNSLRSELLRALCEDSFRFFFLKGEATVVVSKPLEHRHGNRSAGFCNIQKRIYFALYVSERV